MTHSLRDARVARILAAALGAVDPGRAVTAYLRAHPIPEGRRVYALAVGKAAMAMLEGALSCVTLERALVITKHGEETAVRRLGERLPALVFLEAGHPVPDVRSVAAGEAALAFVASLEPDELLLCLISGGGSALMSAPFVPLEDIQALTSALLACGARIDEINTLRRHLDRVKGGRLAQAARLPVLSLILSDVVGSPLEAIASGPTAPDPTTREQAFGIVEKYFGISSRKDSTRRRGNLPVESEVGLLRSARNDLQISPSIPQALTSSPETPKPDDVLFDRVQNVIVGENALAVQAALEQALREGFQVASLGSDWQGEAREVGRALAEYLRVAIEERQAPFCFIAGGETTVTIDGGGKGGRNQELALAAVPYLSGLEDAMLIGLASDGEDGPTDAAGAVATGETLQRAQALGLVPAEYLARNDAYPFFENLGDLIKTGPTGTNVNDLLFLIKF